MQSEHKFSNAYITNSLINMRLVIFNIDLETNQYIDEKEHHKNTAINTVLFNTETDEEITLVYPNKERETFARKYIEDLVENGITKCGLTNGTLNVYVIVKRLP